MSSAKSFNAARTSRVGRTFSAELKWSLLILVLCCRKRRTTSCGCSKPPGTVSGRVSYKGKDLSYGTIVFVSQDNQVKQGAIDEDGSYKIENVPAGPAKVAVIPIAFVVTRSRPRGTMSTRGHPVTAG